MIIAQHWEQALSERNQTLARQLSFRHVTFALQRRFADPAWVNMLQVRHSTLNIDYVEAYGDLPGPYELSDPTSDTRDDSVRLALPTRIDRFQQGALAVQWDALPYFYEPPVADGPHHAPGFAGHRADHAISSISRLHPKSWQRVWMALE